MRVVLRIAEPRVFTRNTASMLTKQLSSLSPSVLPPPSMLLIARRCFGESFQSQAIEQAQRITAPTPQHPATGPALPPNTISKCVDWREHWDPFTKKPYYHNLITNECTWEIPKEFPTRFEWYYARVEAEKPKTKTAATADASSVEAVTIPAMSYKDKLLQYGTAGLALYGIIHFGSLAIVFLLMEAGFDLPGIARRFKFDVEKMSKKKSRTALFVLAIAVNKIFSPLHFVATLLLAPRLTPSLRALWLTMMG